MKTSLRRVAWLFALVITSGASCAHERVGTPAPAAGPEIDPAGLRRTVEALARFGTRHTLSDQASTTRGIGAAAAWVHRELAAIARHANGRLIVEDQAVRVTDTTDRIPSPITLTNVIATLPGTAPDGERSVIIVSGHYDSRAADVMDPNAQAPGANDDASGVAVVIEVARAMALSGTPFRHTVVFAAVAGEEQGLTGAAALAAKARSENWPVVAMITNDIVGNSIGGSGLSGKNRVRVFSEGVPSAETPLQVQTRQTFGGESDGASRQLARYIGKVAEAAQPDFKVTQIFRRDRYARGGDHIPFLRQGYAAVRITEPYEDFSRQHADVITRPDGKREGDLPEYVDFEYLAKVARVNLTAIAALATAPAAPRGATIDAGLSYDTTLTWEPSPGATGYDIVYRDTAAPIWQHRQDVGPATRAVLKNVSKDDFQFAIEAYDAAGHTSLPAVPTPKRAK